jgi:hypothetical protein
VFKYTNGFGLYAFATGHQNAEETRRVKVKLTKKLADMFNGVDLSGVHEGDVVDVPPRDAGILLAAEWALPTSESESSEKKNVLPPRAARAQPNDRPKRRRR